MFNRNVIKSYRSFHKSSIGKFKSNLPLNNNKVINEFIDNDIKVVYNKKSTSFQFLKENKSFSYNNVFLRDSSTSSNSIDYNSGQKLFTTASIINSYPINIEIPNSKQIKIYWNDGDYSIYDQKFLELNSTIESRKQDKAKNFEDEIIAWDSNHNMLTVDNLPRYEYNDYLTNDSTLSLALNDLNKFGLVQITNITKNLSDEEHESQKLIQIIGERIAYLKKTFYGEIFDVKSKPNAINIAYTNQFLPLHMDLLYYESPPGLQLLHFIKNKSKGGENVFVDGFAAARHVKTIDSPAYQALLTVPINYHYEKNGHSYYYSRPLIVENEVIEQGGFGEYKDHFREINYSPPFQAPFDFGITGEVIGDDNNHSKISGAKEKGDRHLFQDFLRGFKEFEDYINNKENQLKFKVEEGSCIIFDNRRILHARDQFDNNSGERWLKGCYIDKDSYLSKLRVMKKK
ncbi:Trimethyllysine dioxygenase, mitochondrial [Wickerhamomyces ciferrii]|uniref:Trimethyllysine dioxygenase, mitochondrial n=1 Tax=Wickerhamomyces ciferrii (strain ATCC 14091 / BCRC 22168 / CBS 111 / JCM 3599 / NBRC 0793 / NRRL Y-1031 F-60-10) TaxID=1206466 RepID=K0KN74_WICCF|nr:Trimethyllysine dioxygenase, mitochondrial [Wickerhamomyces ciferrii]CCH42799.1 Trimethyllysine dioxygenase, mitochondrial [Wickerhamomyces ciferrii]